MRLDKHNLRARAVQALGVMRNLKAWGLPGRELRDSRLEKHHLGSTVATTLEVERLTPWSEARASSMFSAWALLLRASGLNPGEPSKGQESHAATFLPSPSSRNPAQ